MGARMTVACISTIASILATSECFEWNDFTVAHGGFHDDDDDDDDDDDVMFNALDANPNQKAIMLLLDVFEPPNLGLYGHVIASVAGGTGSQPHSICIANHQLSMSARMCTIIKYKKVRNLFN
ncbi:hypothetical protein SeMB42_g00666 [Synchytrium endobioticum]|uniref:Uncharacterized protein n=1 Tax=Synchytrium endobioticum TaxID=286115 RepID=A0A507DPQ4_9FUNG|nr:hypothetical protein SeMB42_g00666 [Synchytrium endobioticum]